MLPGHCMECPAAACASAAPLPCTHLSPGSPPLPIFSMILIEIQDTLHPGMPRNKYSMAALEGLDEQQAEELKAKARAAAAQEAEEGEGGEAALVLDDRDRFEIVMMRRAVTSERGVECVEGHAAPLRASCPLPPGSALICLLPRLPPLLLPLLLPL